MKTLLLHLTDGPNIASSQAVARKMAARNQSHLIGLFVVPTVLSVYWGTDSGEILPHLHEQFLATAKRITEKFAADCAADNLSFETRVVEGSILPVIAEASRVVDLTIAAKYNSPPATLLEMEASIQDLALSSASPALIVPHPFDGEVGRRILVTWNNSRESSHAVREALPLLKAAEQVTLFSVNPTAPDDIPLDGIARYLSRHGVPVETASTIAKDSSVTDAILGKAAQTQSDLIVMGAWGHSRLRELVLGGATRDILRLSPLPVMMAH